MEGWASCPLFHIEFVSHGRENRILLFASDRKASVGKIIYSLGCDKQASIDCISIHEKYQGMKLGPLLIRQCRLVLSEMGFNTLQLSAEEDTRRYGRLVNFYRSEGFEEKEGVKITFLQEDSLLIRKVAMSKNLNSYDHKMNAIFEDDIFLPASITHVENKKVLSAAKDGSLSLTDKSRKVTDEEASSSADSTGMKRLCSEAFESSWLIAQEVAEDDISEVFKGPYLTLESGFGRYLSALPSGEVVAASSRKGNWERFQMQTTCSDDACAHGTEQCRHNKQSTSLRTYHGQYLRFKKRKRCESAEASRLIQVPEPSPGWRLGAGTCGPASLSWSDDWEAESNNARSSGDVFMLRKHFLKFTLGRASLRDALKVLCEASSSAGKLLLVAAETAHAQRHPDWFKIVALLHGIGEAVGLMFGNDQENEEPLFAWTKTDEVICAHPEEKASGSCLVCCSERVTVPVEGSVWWGKTEYLYHMLEHNRSMLPKEATVAIRLLRMRCLQQGTDSEDSPASTFGIDADTLFWVHLLHEIVEDSAETVKNTPFEKLPTLDSIWKIFGPMLRNYIPRVDDLEW